MKDKPVKGTQSLLLPKGEPVLHPSPVHTPIHPSTHPPIHPSIIHPSNLLSTDLSIHSFIIYLSNLPPIYPSIIHPSIIPLILPSTRPPSIHSSFHSFNTNIH